MDGNGRWAEANGYPRIYGHIRGTKRVREIITSSRKNNIEVITLYAFSTENWKRPGEEVSVLFRLLKKFLKREILTLTENDIRLKVIGDVLQLSSDVQDAIKIAEQKTQTCKSMVLNLAVNYGGKWDILQACDRLISERKVITEDNILKSLSTAGLPDVDLLIRTGGDHRISNFLLWQAAYAELNFVQKSWPEFQEEDFMACLDKFAGIDRRFGGLKNIHGSATS